TGDGTFFTGIGRDITERRRAEEMLRESKRAAEDANEAKSEFLSRVSHEVRTPVHGTLGMLDLAMDSELSLEQAEYLSLARSSTESLLSIINDILDFSKIGARQLVLDEAPFDLRAVLEEAVDLLALRAHGKGLELLCHLPSGVPTALVGDAGRLRQVLVNLLANAVKFTSQGEVVVSAALVGEPDDRVELHFAVRDTGAGIPEDKQEVIFEAFRQADGSTTRAHGGTGLGLTISQELVGLMGGRIEVDSRPGRGSTFHFTCQLPKQAGGPEDDGEVAPEWLRHLRVLVVDGSETGRGILAEQLGDWGTAAVILTDGSSALAEFDFAAGESRPFDLVLLDVATPESGGFALAERLRGAAGDGVAVVMMLSSNNVHGDAARCCQLGMTVYLVKPVKRAALLDAILSAARPREERTAAARPPDAVAGSDRPSLRVLLAEDNAAALVIARKRLEKRGHDVRTAGNGLEAVALAREMEFDLVLMDVEMPGMNGLEATRAIRAIDTASARRLPIIAMTAYARQQDRLRCLEAGMDGYLSKPMSDAELHREIERVLASGAGGDTPPTLDIAAALAATDGDGDLLIEAIELFLREDYPRQLAGLADGVAREDAAVVRAAAHGIKGAAGYLGGRALSAVASRLEEMGRNGDLSGAGQALDELEMEMARFRESLGLPGPVAVAESDGGA
ncbi:MAG: response regulator, partial [Dehalococcoidales bacterium]